MADEGAAGCRSGVLSLGVYDCCPVGLRTAGGVRLRQPDGSGETAADPPEKRLSCRRLLSYRRAGGVQVHRLPHRRRGASALCAAGHQLFHLPANLVPPGGVHRRLCGNPCAGGVSDLQLLLPYGVLRPHSEAAGFLSAAAGGVPPAPGHGGGAVRAGAGPCQEGAAGRQSGGSCE